MIVASETSSIRTRSPLLAGWLFVGIVAALAAAVWLQLPESRFQPPFEFSWWFVALLAFLFESLVIHLEFRKDAHSFSLGEIAVVVALFGASPGEILVGVLLGDMAALVFSRRQSALKLSFNLAQYALNTGVGVALFLAIVDPVDIVGPRNLLASLLAVTSALVVSEACIVLVILLTGGVMSGRDVAETVGLGLFGAVLNGVFGFLFVLLGVVEPSMIWIAAIPPAVMFVAYRTHASQRNQTERLQSMHRVTESIHTAPIVDDAMAAAAASARQLVDATWVEVLVFTDRPALEAARTFDDGERSMAMIPTILHPEHTAWWDRVTAQRRPVISSGDRSASNLAPPITKDFIAVPIVGAEQILHGYLLAADRLGDVSSFTDGDVKLLETVAKQISVALDNGMLETSLAAVTELKERLEEMVESKDRFIASVSHELRTPLTAVIGLSRELENNLETFQPEDVAEFIHLISDQATELSYIIEDLLVAARADIGTLAVRPERIDVRSTVESLTVPSLAYVGTEPIEVRGQSPDGYADGFRFRQVLRNLLTNARRYGGEEVVVEIGQRSGLSTVTVIDNGPGVPPDRVEAIFQPYERAHTEPTQPGSVGLGLAVARQLTRMMGGDLVYRKTNGLTHFEISIPQYAEERIDA